MARKTRFKFDPSVGDETFARNVRVNKRRRLPGLATLKGWGPLLVVGGGPSAAANIMAIRRWPGTVWAINRAWTWCRENGIETTFFSVDPSPALAQDLDGHMPPRSVVATCVDPAVVDMLDPAGARLFTIGEGGINGSVTSATVAPSVALSVGYQPVYFLGCEGSYLADDAGYRSHAYDAVPMAKHLMRVRVGGQEFVTKPDMLVQCKELAKVMRKYPQYLTEVSGGLLRAMVEHGTDYEEVDFRFLKAG